MEALRQDTVVCLGQGWVARVLSISAAGIGMQLGEGPSPGIILTLALHGAAECPATATARVIHCSERGDGTWFMHAEFLTPFEEEEQLQRVLW